MCQNSDLEIAEKYFFIEPPSYPKTYKDTIPNIIIMKLIMVEGIPLVYENLSNRTSSS